MKLFDIVTQLRNYLPRFTDYFSDTLSISSIVASGGVATITTSAPHGLASDNGVSISNVEQENSIDSVSKDGLVFTFTTTLDHDLTLGYSGYENINLIGFTDSLWNGSFELIDVPDRKTFKVRSTNTLPVLNSAEKILEVRIDGVNGFHYITVLDTTTFTISGNINDGNYFNGFVKTSVRIAGSATIERAIEQYTKQNENDLWMFVVASDAFVSKNRNIVNDSQVSIGASESIRLRVVDGFSVFIVKNTKNESAAVEAVDISRHELLAPILKSLLGARFDTGLAVNDGFKTMLLGHNFVDYNRVTFLYQYSFEYTYDITSNDSSDGEDTRAFSKIQYAHSIGGEDVTDATIVDVELPK